MLAYTFLTISTHSFIVTCGLVMVSTVFLRCNEGLKLFRRSLTSNIRTPLTLHMNKKYVLYIMLLLIIQNNFAKILTGLVHETVILITTVYNLDCTLYRNSLNLVKSY